MTDTPNSRVLALLSANSGDVVRRLDLMKVMDERPLTFAIMAKRDCAILSHLEKPLRQVSMATALPFTLFTLPSLS